MLSDISVRNIDLYNYVIVQTLIRTYLLNKLNKDRKTGTVYMSYPLPIYM